MHLFLCVNSILTKVLNAVLVEYKCIAKIRRLNLDLVGICLSEEQQHCADSN
jgi:hypothetical protein